jgi:hypothetical protein
MSRIVRKSVQDNKYPAAAIDNQIFLVGSFFQAITKDAPFLFFSEDIFRTPGRPKKLFTHKIQYKKNRRDFKWFMCGNYFDLSGLQSRHSNQDKIKTPLGGVFISRQDQVLNLFFFLFLFRFFLFLFGGYFSWHELSPPVWQKAFTRPKS